MRCLPSPRLFLAGLALMLVLPVAASAHSVVSIRGGTITYEATDDPTLNTLAVKPTKSRACGTRRCVQLADPTVEPGMEAERGCVEGRKDVRGNVHVVYCQIRSGARLVLNLGELNDIARIDARIRATVKAGEGNDRIVGSSTADRIFGGPGDDRLFDRGGADVLIGDLGADQVDAGAGDDDITIVEGTTDKVRCGAGSDSVGADTVDGLSGDCETFTKVTSPGASPPVTRATAARTQRVGTSRKILVTVRSGVAAQLTVGGVIAIGRTRYKLTAANASGTEARVRLTVPNAVLRRLRGGRTALARIDVTAADSAGNTSAGPGPRVTIRR